jgi:RHS repeat-associated protein
VTAASCTGTGFARLDMAYDALGHRITLTETPAAGSVTTTAFTYGGDAVVRETSTTGTTVVTRTFTVDEAGAIVKMHVTGMGTPNDGDYLVTWNGHGDAVELSRIDPDTGLLAPANRFSYGTWGTPTLTTVGGFGDLGFRYRYVGRFDVQWDSSTNVPAGLLYMHARHYSPEIGRFLQPDPSALNLYRDAGNNPATNADPAGYAGGCSHSSTA